jgi:hypothetical protein
MMGLDITAYKNTKLVEVLTDADEFEDKYSDRWEEYDYVYRGEHDFPDRLPPIVPGGVYKFDDSFRFRAGSYSGYNVWREKLSDMALGVIPRMVWDNYEQFTGRPFVELIHFSDCEGILGTEVCKKLLKDFQDFQDSANQHQDEWFTERYNDWHKAFEFAADNGYVDFH